MLKRPHYIALGLIVLLTLILFNLPSRTTARLKLGIGSSFLPLEGLASSIVGQASRLPLLSRSELLKQNEALRLENQKLRLQSRQQEEILQENGRLRKLYGWQQQQAWKLKPGNVVLREPANWWRAVQIDLGTRDGISNNLPVLSPEGFLVGRIDSVSLTHSRVVLLGDPNCKVAARVENEAGVIGASGPLETQLVEM